MNLRNYIDIFELEREQQPNYREQLYVSGRNLLLKFNHFTELLREKNEFTYSQIAKLFGISEKQLRKWRCGVSPIPLKTLKIISDGNENIKNALENEIDYVSSSRGICIKIPREINCLFIEILGRFCGDGSSGKYDGDYKWSLKEEGKRFVKNNLRDMEIIFGIEGKYIDYEEYAENLIRSKPLVLLFHQIFNYTENFKKTYNIKPPHFIKNIEWSKRKFFTTGIIDTEGSFYYTNKSYFFELNMVNENLVNEVAVAFNEFGIPYNKKIGKKHNIKILSYGKVNCELIYDIFQLKNEKHVVKLSKWDII